jgi:hypothetical protein
MCLFVFKTASCCVKECGFYETVLCCVQECVCYESALCGVQECVFYETVFFVAFRSVVYLRTSPL